MKKRTINIIWISAIIILVSTSCTTNNRVDYRGEHPELYSIAVNSLLGVKGYFYSEKRFEAEIKILEEDDYGRKLFLYFEITAVSTYNLIISQKSDDEYTFFYPDYNFISARENNFSGEEIEELKRKNDWDMEIDVDRCVGVEIVRKKDKGSVKEETVKELYNRVLGKDAQYNKFSTVFLTTDNYGRSIYYGYGTSSSDRHIIMLFEPDGSYDESRCFIELSNPYKYQDELKQFKDLNGWNEPLD